MPTDAENAQAAEDALVAAIGTPKRVKGDAGEAEAHPLPDQIALERHLASKAAASSGARGLRFTKLVPPGID
jgi:hypothetical protein